IRVGEGARENPRHHERQGQCRTGAPDLAGDVPVGGRRVLGDRGRAPLRGHISDGAGARAGAVSGDRHQQSLRGHSLGLGRRARGRARPRGERQPSPGSGRPVRAGARLGAPARWQRDREPNGRGAHGCLDVRATGTSRGGPRPRAGRTRDARCRRADARYRGGGRNPGRRGGHRRAALIVSAPVAPRELARVLTLRDLVLIVVGVTIGSGIFTVPGAVLRQSGGDLGVALLVWLLGSVLALLGALTFGELGAMLPDAGGSYVYVRDAFGPLPAFLLGWTLFLAINSGGTATLAVAFANYLGELVPLAPAAHKLAAVAMIAAVAAVNIRGVRQAASVQDWSTALKVGALLALAVAGLTLGDGFHRSDARAFTTPLSFASFSAAGVALLGVLWAYEGWQNVTNSAGEARDPQRTFARGIGFGTAALVAIYLTATDRVAADAVRTLFGSGAARLVTLVILVSIFSAANGMVLTGPRMYFAMARDRVFFRSLADVHPRFGTPALAV